MNNLSVLPQGIIKNDFYGKENMGNENKFYSCGIALLSCYNDGMDQLSRHS